MDIPETLPKGQYAIYALIDPTDQLVYYVGQTRKPRVRFVQHLTTRHHKGNKAAWLRRLEQQGQRPHMQILELVEGQEEALAKEQKWIHLFTEKGMPLLNGEMQPKADRWAIIPIRQETLVLFGYPIVIAWLLNGDIAASLKSLCNVLNLARYPQIRRIRNDAALAGELLLVIIKTPGGPQPTEMLTVKAVALWLEGLELNMIAPEKRPTILALMREAPDVFYHHFHKEEKIEAMGDHIVALEARQKALEERPAGSAAQARKRQPPQDGPILTAEHRNQVYALARHLRDQTGVSVAALFAELAETFDVEDMSDIPDAGWEDVTSWFWEYRQRSRPGAQ